MKQEKRLKYLIQLASRHSTSCNVSIVNANIAISMLQKKEDVLYSPELIFTGIDITDIF